MYEKSTRSTRENNTTTTRNDPNKKGSLQFRGQIFALSRTQRHLESTNSIYQAWGEKKISDNVPLLSRLARPFPWIDGAESFRPVLHVGVRC